MHKLRDNRTEGATQIARHAAELLRRSPDAATARAVVEAQPAMAPLFHLANRTLLASDPGAAIDAFLSELDQSGARAAMNAAALLGSVVMTYSSSETVRRALLAARPRRIYCPESRPLCEGVTLARSLEQAVVIADAAVWRTMPEVDTVLVGADAISPQGVVNKVGTALVALAAREWKRPIYAVATSLKLLPWRRADEARDPAEIAAGVEAVNYYFDATPLEWFTAIITERGALSAGAVRDQCKATSVHPALSDIAR